MESGIRADDRNLEMGWFHNGDNIRKGIGDDRKTESY